MYGLNPYASSKNAVLFCLFPLRSENSLLRIFLPLRTAPHPVSTTCSAEFSCSWHYMLCHLPDLWCAAQGRKTAIWLFPQRGTLPESCDIQESRIWRKRLSGNLTAWLCGCLLSALKWWRHGKIIRVTEAGLCCASSLLCVTIEPDTIFEARYG